MHCFKVVRVNINASPRFWGVSMDNISAVNDNPLDPTGLSAGPYTNNVKLSARDQLFRAVNLSYKLRASSLDLEKAHFQADKDVTRA